MKTLLLLVLLSCSLCTNSQPSLDSFNLKRVQHTKTSMYVLGAWAAVNIVSGSIGTATSSGSQRSFYQMNLGWGVVNGVLAATGLLRLRHEYTKEISLAASIKEQHKIEKLFAFNTGLDVAYVAAGAWMIEKGKNDADQFKGFGQSLLVQGSFLLVFDAVNLAVHTKNGKYLAKYLDNIKLTATTNGAGLSFFF